MPSVNGEAQEILARAGIRWILHKETTQEWPEATIRPHSRLDGVETQRDSTWQSLVRRLDTGETDFFNGEIVRLAKQVGSQTPVNETLLRISQEMTTNRESPRKYTPTELLQLLGLD